MDEYELTITRRVPNPNYRPRVDEYGGGYDGRASAEREQFSETRAVSAVLTEGEYAAVKRAVLTHWAEEK